jgi:glycosyltransferase involved in cell wall biosynthesis
MDTASGSAPRVSLVIPTKNRCALLLETLVSIQAQTETRWEAVVVDDMSTDDSAHVVEEICRRDPRVRLLRRTGSREGANVCRNQGFSAARGDLILFLDSDDVLAPNCLRRRIEVISSHPELDCVVFQCHLFREQPGDTALVWNTDVPLPDLDRFLLLDVVWQTSGPIWRRAALTRIGPWNENLERWQDWEFHVRALCHQLRYIKCPETDYYFRMPTGDRESIGAGWLAHDALLSYESLFRSIRDLLTQTGFLTQGRRRLLAGLYLWLADCWSAFIGTRVAVRVWQDCRREGLVGPVAFAAALTYLLGRNIPGLRRLDQWYLRRYLSKMYRVFDDSIEFWLTRRRLGLSLH